MPIRAEMKARYPADWKAIRGRILLRAGHCCEGCRVPNGITIRRRLQDATVYAHDRNFNRDDAHEFGPPVKVVLTIAHIHNPDPADCRPENLQALCQLCHNRHDAKMRAANAAATRAKRSTARQPSLFTPADE